MRYKIFKSAAFKLANKEISEKENTHFPRLKEFIIEIISANRNNKKRNIKIGKYTV